MENHTIPESALNTIVAALKEPKDYFEECKTPALSLWHCMKYLAKALKISLKKPVQIQDANIEEQLHSLCTNNGLQTRVIDLTGAWWKKDIGPVLGFYETVEHPAAIIPCSMNRYLLVVPSKKMKCIMTAEMAQQLLPHGMMFYKLFPEKKLKLYDLAKFSFINLYADSLRIFSMQFFIVLLGFITPIVMGILFEEIIPNAAKNLFWQFIIILTINTFVMTLFSAVLMISTVRVRLKITASVEAAIWDRLVRLPMQFFRRFTAGDLANRAAGMDRIQQIMTNSVLTSISSGFLSLTALALMFYYSVALAIGTVVLLLILALVAMVFNIRQLFYLRASLFQNGRLTGFVLQAINSISKIKMTNSAAKVFQRWAEIFSEKNHLYYKSGKLVMGVTIFNSIFATMTTITLFSLVYFFGNDLSFGNFIAFNALFAQLFVAVLALVSTFSSVMEIFPLYERIKPILDALPEPRQSGINLMELDGKIDLVNISFRYSLETPVVFKGLSLSVKPGELVAFVGSSGQGKSSLFRLLLGIEEPQSGKIYYSDMDLSNLNINCIRKLTGVVLQDSVLFSGSILENIVGHSKNYDIEEVKYLIEKMCFKEELMRMPMGLETILTEQGRTLSNGQRQRLLLARALFKKPKLLLLDEATSSLDNLTQEKIYQYLTTLNTTCLYISHRPSSLRFASKIFLIDNGVVVQSGSFEELIRDSAIFKELVSRGG